MELSYKTNKRPNYYRRRQNEIFRSIYDKSLSRTTTNL